MDVGGGQGTLLAAVLQARPHLRGVLLAPPGVVTRAQQTLRNVGLLCQARAEDGDMFTAVPAEVDLYLLKSVLHDWDDDQVTQILRSCRAAMTRPGARLLVIERLMPEIMVSELAAVALAVVDLMMLTRAGGRERTEAGFRALLTGADLDRRASGADRFALCSAGGCRGIAPGSRR